MSEHRVPSRTEGDDRRRDMKMLSHAEARRVYDRLGRVQDWQAFLQDGATDAIAGRLDLASAGAVFEFGCGTGRYAADLLASRLPPHASYRGVDLSPVMIGFARRRLAPFASRADVRLTDGGAPVDEPAAAYDRFVSNFVLDVMPGDEIEGVVGAAHRMLRPGGLVGLCSLTGGRSPASRAFVAAWLAVRSVRRGLVGGSRPIDLREYLRPPGWRVRHVQWTVRLSVPIQGIVAERA